MSGVILLVLRFALAAALYAFLGWAIWLLWKDLRQQSKAMAGPQVPPIVLSLQGDEPSAAYRFTIPEVLVGRDPACQCHLEDQTISAQHARLAYHHSQWWVEDMRSRNGTFLNQEPAKEPLVLADGDQLRFGQVVFQIRLGDSETSV